MALAKLLVLMRLSTSWHSFNQFDQQTSCSTRQVCMAACLWLRSMTRRFRVERAVAGKMPSAQAPSDSDMHSHAGTTLNYFLDGGLNRAAVLFPGIAAAALATAFGAWAHVRSQQVRLVAQHRPMQQPKKLS